MAGEERRPPKAEGAKGPARVVLRYEQTWPDLLERLDRDRRDGQLAGGARSVLVGLLDADSFVEMGTVARREPVQYDADDFDADAPAVVDGDAMVSGWGSRRGRPIFVAGDVAERGESVRGAAAAAKVQRVRRLALDQGAPFVGIFALPRSLPGGEPVGAELIDGGLGVDVQAEIDADERIPKLAAIAGGLDVPTSLEALWSHVVVMVRDATIQVPDGARLDADACLSAGLVDRVVDDLAGIAEPIGHALDLLPTNRWESVPPVDSRATAGAAGAPASSIGPAMTPDEVAAALVDPGTSFELRPGIAPTTRTFLARVGGVAVGVIALSDPGGAHEAGGAEKRVRLLRLCADFGMPSIVVHGDLGVADPGPCEVSIGLGGAAPPVSSAYAISVASTEPVEDRSASPVGDATVNSADVAGHLDEVLAALSPHRTARWHDPRVNQGRRGNLFRSRRG